MKDVRSLDQFKDRLWRINNLYWITDKEGRRIKFRLNWAQERLWKEIHYANLILKARQLGITSFIQLFFLDSCLFNSNVRAGVIAHNIEDARVFFRDRIKFAYDNLPEAIKAMRPLTSDSALELTFNNNSSIRVGTSLRSGTLNFLHVSEYAKLCAKYPEKAREVRSGSLNTVQAGQVIFIESTAEGTEGHFAEMCREAEAMKRRGEKLTKLDFKFHFYPWHQAPEYRLKSDVIIPVEFDKYFDGLANQGVRLDKQQKAWYYKKSLSQADDMKREFPATPDEAFSASVEGSYYGSLIAAAEMEGRVGEFQALPGLPVNTSWDIGRSDYTSIWFWQKAYPRIRVVGFFQACGEGMPFYAEQVRQLYLEHDWSRDGAIDYVPHDAKVIEWGSNRSRIEQLIEKKFKPQIPTQLSLHDGINAVRAILPLCVFDLQNCSEGLRALKHYQKTWNEDRGMFTDAPLHNAASHPSDAFRYLACAYQDDGPVVQEKGEWFLDPAGRRIRKEDVLGTHEFDVAIRQGLVVIHDDLFDLPPPSRKTTPQIRRIA
jgi:hypothetical protein